MAELESPQLYLSMILAESEPVEMVKRSIDSVKEVVDDIYITITYKEDKPKEDIPLVEILQEYGAHISYFKWVYNFSKARQFNMDQVPHGPNQYIYWHDADDIQQNPNDLREILEEMHERRVAAWFFPYWYQVVLNDDGSVHEVLVEHKRERIIRNDNSFKWIGPLHETLIEQQKENMVKYSSEDCVVVHLPTAERKDANIDRNIEILEQTIEKENRKDPRTIMYLGKAYFDKAKIYSKDKKEFKMYSDLALTLFHEYLHGSGEPGTEEYREPSGWAEERSTAWSYIAEIAILSAQPLMAKEAYQEAINECPYFPNYYIDKAMVCCMLEEFKEAKHYLNIATNMEMPKTTIITTPRDMKTRALEVAFQIAMHENKLDDAKAYMQELSQILPNDEGVQKRLQTVHSLHQFNRACQSAVFLGKYLESVDEEEKIKHLIQSFSKDMQSEQFASQMRHKFMPKRIWAQDEITILCGPGFENWSPKSMETGLGGSEEAVVHMAKQLTDLGWHVTVYGDPGEEAGDHDGVEYRPWYELNYKDDFNVLVLWRSIGFIDVNPKARYTMVWLHDIPNNPDFTEERINKIDKIAVLSEYHKSLLRMYKDGEFIQVPDHKIFVTSNGIADLGVEEWNGNPKRMIYASSPDRGLIYLLKNWPRVYKEVPDAELHVYYGFDLYDEIHKDNPARMQWKEKMMKLLDQDGIFYHGRVGHQELHEAYAKSGVWSYPTGFEEISCISAMKAQALGAIPVCTNYAALEETVKNGVRVDVDITEESGQEEYFNNLIELIQDKKTQSSMRPEMMKFARDYFGWDKVAKQWNKEFNDWLHVPGKKFQI